MVMARDEIACDRAACCFLIGESDVVVVQWKLAMQAQKSQI